MSSSALPLLPYDLKTIQHSLWQDAVVSDRDVSSAKPLYQQCIEIVQQLSQGEGFSDLFAIQKKENRDLDPMTCLIRIFRQGLPLLMLLARVQGRPFSEYLERFDSYTGDVKRIPKMATFRFLKGCMDDVDIESDDLFMISDLFNDEPKGSVKVIKVVKDLLDDLVSTGRIAQLKKPGAMSFREGEDRKISIDSVNAAVEARMWESI